MPIWLTQWLCPRRHCAYAVPWDPAERSVGDVEALGAELARGLGLNERCGICGGPIAPESAPTVFPTTAAAMGALAEAQAAQLATRRLLDDRGLTVERLPRPERLS